MKDSAPDKYAGCRPGDPQLPRTLSRELRRIKNQYRPKKDMLLYTSFRDPGRNLSPTRSMAIVAVDRPEPQPEPLRLTNGERGLARQSVNKPLLQLCAEAASAPNVGRKKAQRRLQQAHDYVGIAPARAREVPDTVTPPASDFTAEAVPPGDARRTWINELHQPQPLVNAAHSQREELAGLTVRLSRRKSQKFFGMVSGRQAGARPHTAPAPSAAGPVKALDYHALGYATRAMSAATTPSATTARSGGSLHASRAWSEEAALAERAAELGAKKARHHLRMDLWSQRADRITAILQGPRFQHTASPFVSDCDQCNTRTKVYICASCRNAAYCSVACQKRAYAGHHRECLLLNRPIFISQCVHKGDRALLLGLQAARDQERATPQPEILQAGAIPTPPGRVSKLDIPTEEGDGQDGVDRAGKGGREGQDTAEAKLGAKDWKAQREAERGRQASARYQVSVVEETAAQKACRAATAHYKEAASLLRAHQGARSAADTDPISWFLEGCCYSGMAVAQLYCGTEGRAAKVLEKAEVIATQQQDHLALDIARDIAALAEVTAARPSPVSAGSRPRTPAGSRPPTAGSRPHTAGSGPPAPGARPHTAGSGPPSAGSRPPASGSGPPVAGARPHTAGSGPASGGSRPPTSGSGPPSAGSRPHTTGSGPPSAGSRPQTAGSGPPSAGSRPQSSRPQTAGSARFAPT